MTHRELSGGVRQRHSCFEYLSRAAHRRHDIVLIGCDGSARNSTGCSFVHTLLSAFFYPMRSHP